MTQNQKDNAWEFLRNNAALILAIIGAAIWAGKIQSKQEDHQEMLIHIGNEGAKIKQDVSDVKGDVKAIRAIMEKK